mgnify:CR=1 FL=1|tara:strand:- start:318 stop:524 length:207 start_codon:yes stop_codon:yes gene_type:complete
MTVKVREWWPGREEWVEMEFRSWKQFAEYLMNEIDEDITERKFQTLKRGTLEHNGQTLKGWMWRGVND